MTTTSSPEPKAADKGASGRHGHHGPGGGTPALALGALGIVFGDIGTSPLYALRETFEGHGHELHVNPVNVYGVLSLITWSLIIVISIKYLAFVMRADNEGEGGILALTALLRRDGETSKGRRKALLLLGLFGTALLYGDAAITPAISVLSAVEGVTVQAPDLEPAVLPIAVAILVGIFVFQRRGTDAIGKIFGPVMVVWFSVLALLGMVQIVKEPGVFKAINPMYAIDYFQANAFTGFLALGSMFLVVTGGEALYADMGHFGRRPIQMAWFVMVLPALLISYYGQGVLLLNEPDAIENPLFRLAPEWGLYPMVVLATCATIIASQALISGVFSLTMQAIQLGYAPRHRIRHTSAAAFGQVYIPVINWALMIACIALVIGFRSSTNLAAAYGLAVTSTMVITALLFYFVLRERFRWAAPAAIALCGAFLVVDLAYFGANLFKIPAGGWFPILVGTGMFTLMTTWSTGRSIVAELMHRNDIRLVDYVDGLRRSKHPPRRVEATAVYLFSSPGLTPPALIANVRHNDVLHQTTIVLSIATALSPRILPAKRSEVTDLGDGIYQVILRYGFMEDPDVMQGLREGQARKLAIDPTTSAFILGAEAVRATPGSGMAIWREHLFVFLTRNATPAAMYFGLPADRTITISRSIEI
ncbi:potassium transporter Kup [Iamia sp. SCSIO 61187]|uniref:potassium transporter Kup n=1 Tax=Iamia sp. SCSIO 61187 TaxID=2722752 RepID=UPI001C6399DC|nr:potassium transporter Kup [Iamia sp. SCSIO 61187]QYG95094.1 potassium transporter Kup [Iamia sp. SCSIO 61187]